MLVAVALNGPNHANMTLVTCFLLYQRSYKILRKVALQTKGRLRSPAVPVGNSADAVRLVVMTVIWQRHTDRYILTLQRHPVTLLLHAKDIERESK